jgi:hypothetical protein
MAARPSRAWAEAPRKPIANSISLSRNVFGSERRTALFAVSSARLPVLGDTSQQRLNGS